MRSTKNWLGRSQICVRTAYGSVHGTGKAGDVVTRPYSTCLKVNANAKADILRNAAHGA
jgi:hypothetical protein